MATQECWKNKKQAMKILGITEKKEKIFSGDHAGV